MRFYVTTPIYYINAEPHLGHAYTTMVADAVARAHRLLGHDVLFLTGTDEHGQKVERAAQKRGMAPKEFADQISQKFRELFDLLNVSNDDFIRTTEPRHHRAAQTLWQRVRDRGYIYKGSYEGWYCTIDEVFVPDTQLAQGQRCPICGGPVERLSEESYFFKLSEFQRPLLEHYEKHPEFVTPEIRRNEMLSFIRAGLQDLSISRTSFKWGIPVPDDPAHVMYVWFDALTNYLTAVGFGGDSPVDESRFAAFWPADVHLMGKEIVRQHAVYWPAFLMAAALPIPQAIVSHGWWLMEGAKMSKSRGNVVEPQGYVARFGVDALRYFVMREMVFGQDASFTDEAFLTRFNADLANDLGNLVSRTTTMIHRYRNGIVPHADFRLESRPEERSLQVRLEGLVESVSSYMTTSYLFSAALREIWDAIALTNKYIVVREPWALAKDPHKSTELDTALYQAANALRIIGSLIEPVMPATAVRIRRMLGMADEKWGDLKDRRLEPGTRLGPTESLFPRIEQTVEELRQMADEQRTAAPGAAPPQPLPAADNRISIDDFMKVDLRVAKVVAAERVPNTKKLVKLQIDLGSEQRTIVAGIADAYEPDAMVGRSIVVVANLKPATVRGVESNGMLLAASPEGGMPIVVGFDRPPEPGTRVR